MAGPELYSQYNITINGVLSTESSDVDFGNENKDVDVETLALGWNGSTPSPDKTTAKIDGFIPQAGLEIDLDDLEKTRAFVTIGFVPVFGALTKQTSVGQIRNVRKKSGVGQASKWSFDFVGTPLK